LSLLPTLMLISDFASTAHTHFPGFQSPVTSIWFWNS